MKAAGAPPHACARRGSRSTAVAIVAWIGTALAATGCGAESRGAVRELDRLAESWAAAVDEATQDQRELTRSERELGGRLAQLGAEQPEAWKQLRGGGLSSGRSAPDLETVRRLLARGGLDAAPNRAGRDVARRDAVAERAGRATTGSMAQVPFTRTLFSVRRVEDLVERLGDVPTVHVIDAVSGETGYRLEYPLLAGWFATVVLRETEFRQGTVAVWGRPEFSRSGAADAGSTWLSELLAAHAPERERYRIEQERRRVDAEVKRIADADERAENARLDRVAQIECERDLARSELAERAEARRDALVRRYVEECDALAARLAAGRREREEFERRCAEEERDEEERRALRRETEFEAIDALAHRQRELARMRAADPAALAEEEARIEQERERSHREWEEREAGQRSADSERRSRGLAVLDEPIAAAERRLAAIPEKQTRLREELELGLARESQELEDRFRTLLEALQH